MSYFLAFKQAVAKQFEIISKHELFKTEISKDDLWDTYLKSFPEGTNPIFKERTEHDCNACKSFIKTAGNVIAIINGQRVSIWDFKDKLDPVYEIVAASMSELAKSAKIRNIFLHDQKNIGIDENHQMLQDGNIKTWNHFHYKLPKKFVNTTHRDTVFSKTKANVSVFERALVEFKQDSLEIVLDLIDQNSLYRGEEHRSAVEAFYKEYIEFYKIKQQFLQDENDWIWLRGSKLGIFAKFRNTVIGTLVSDLSNGMDLDKAVAAFENKVAPHNYKRTSALVTKGMIEQAKKKVEELGIKESLSRRYANKDDITVNNILFIDRPTNSAKELDVFDEMKNEAKVKTKFDKVEEIGIDKFIKDVLPKSDEIEVMFENKHAANLMSLIAPSDLESKNIFKWKNNFSWSYNGEVTDSIKERVKRAGGIVDAYLRCSLSWYNYDDLDIHVIEPANGGQLICFRNKRNPYTHGQLDIDMNAGGANSREAVENIFWPDKSKMIEGVYDLWVHNFAKRENKDEGFEVEIEFDGQKYNFNYQKPVRNGEMVHVAKFEYSHENGITFQKSLNHTETSKEIWHIKTQQFQKVSMIMNSPNHWDGNETGNKHWFFILKNCKNPKSARGFYNEFLNSELTPHRKVFEIMGSKMKVSHSDDQLSGLGFSSTQRNSLLCKVSGSFSRMLRVNF